jgi:hypothetical protein
LNEEKPTTPRSRSRELSRQQSFQFVLLTVGSQKKKKEKQKEIWQLKQEMKTTWGFCSLSSSRSPTVSSCRTNSKKKKKNERNIKILRDGILFQL